MSTWKASFEMAPRRRLAAGQAVFLRGDPVSHVHLVLEGAVALERSLPGGEPLTLHSATQGQLVAEASLFSETYHCDGVAEPGATLAVLPRAAFLKALEDRPADALALLAMASHEVQRQRTRVEILRLRRLADRLDAYLELYGPPEPGRWVAVAEAIGVTPPALYRELAKRRRRDAP